MVYVVITLTQHLCIYKFIFECCNVIYLFLYAYPSFNVFDRSLKVQIKTKQEIRHAINFKYENVIPIYKLPDNKKEKIETIASIKWLKKIFFFSWGIWNQ